MKKYINIFFIVFTFLILFSFKNVSASTINTTINFDNNDKFNYFYEMEHNTLFYKFLVSHQYDLEGYLASLTNVNFDNYKYFLSIMNRNEVTGFGYGDESIPQNYTHVLELFVGTELGANFSNSSVNLYNCSNVYRFYYNNNELVYTYSSSPGYTGNASAHYVSPIDFDNIQYLISKIYSSNIEIISSYGNTIDISRVIVDNTTYNIDTGFTSFWNKLKSLFTGNGWYKDYDLENSILSYFKNNSYLVDNYPIKTITSLYTNNLNIPSNLTTLELTYTNNYYFVPKNVNSSNINRYVYTSADSVSSSIGVSLVNMQTNNFYAYDLNQYNPNSNTTFIKITYKESNKAYRIDLSNILSSYNVDLTNFNYLQYGYYFHYVNGKGKTYLYYNSNAWDVYDLSYSLTEDLVISNPNTNSDVTISREDMQVILSTYDLSGESVHVTDINSSQIESDSDYFTNSLDKVSDLTKSLSSVFTFIGSMISLLFATFPPIIQQFFEVLLLIGGIIIIIKLIRG